ncbi:hypothetical protein ABZ671_00485 [Micromonospora sp. NPDC006766]|uniref:hypothetical protein n=1 Tax=Micromonospora sp. NPDC006766 TaxID=3154778 RepID=UPI0033CD7515
MTATTTRPAGSTPAGTAPAPTVSGGPVVVAYRLTCPYCLLRPMPGLLAGSCDSPGCISDFLNDDARYDQ